MEFEYNLDKSAINLEKHGIDFAEGQKLWQDTSLVIIPAKTDDEKRYLCVGLIGNKHWSAVITIRDKKIRIISMRRSRPEEVKLYEG